MSYLCVQLTQQNKNFVALEVELCYYMDKDTISIPSNLLGGFYAAIH